MRSHTNDHVISNLDLLVLYQENRSEWKKSAITLLHFKTNLIISAELTKTMKNLSKKQPKNRMHFDKTSPKNHNPQQQKKSRNATKKQVDCAGKLPNWQHWHFRQPLLRLDARFVIKRNNIFHCSGRGNNMKKVGNLFQRNKLKCNAKHTAKTRKQHHNHCPLFQCCEPKIEHKLSWVCFQGIFWKCLFYHSKQKLCWGYFAFNRTRLIEFWIYTGFRCWNRQSPSLKMWLLVTEPEWTPVSSEISDLCEIPDLLLFVSYFASESKGIEFGNYFFDMCCLGQKTFSLDVRYPQQATVRESL